jgi:hypothetical protein
MSDNEPLLPPGTELKDTPIKVKERIEKYLIKQNMTKASFARIVGISSNALGRFLGQDEPRGDNQTYEAAYLYFRQLKKEKKLRKEKKRKERDDVTAEEKAERQLEKRRKAEEAACTPGFKLLREHYFLHFLANPSDELTQLLGASLDETKVNQLRSQVMLTLTPLEELLLLLDLTAVSSRRPELDAAAPPAHGFAQSAEQLAPADRAARAVAETAYAAAVDNYRNFQRLKTDVATVRQWYIDLAAPAQRRYAPVQAPPARIAFEFDQVEPQDKKRSAADRKAEIDDVDHTQCCLNRVKDFVTLCYAS